MDIELRELKLTRSNPFESSSFESLLFSIGFDSNMIDRYGVEN